MPQGKQGQTKPASPSHQHGQHMQAANSNASPSQMSPMGTNMFMQMQRTVGNRATQVYANQIIQRNPAPQPQVPVPVVAPTVAFHRRRSGTAAPPVPIVQTPAPTNVVAPQGTSTAQTPAPTTVVAPQSTSTTQTPAPTTTSTTQTPAPTQTGTVQTPAPTVQTPTIPSASTLHPTGDDTKDNADMTSGVGGTFSDSFGKRADDLKESYDKTKDAGTAQQSATMGAVASTADLVSGPFQIMSAIRETLAVSGDTNRTGHNKRWQYAGTGTSMIESTGKMVSGGTGLVDKAAKSTGHTKGIGNSSSASDYTGTVAEAISAVKNTIMAVKGIYDMYSKASENGGLDKGEKARGTLEIISNAIQAAQSGIKVAKGIMEIMETSTASLTAVIPGVSIAVSGVKIAIKTVDVIKAGLNRSAMTTMKRDFKGKAEYADILKEKRWYTRNAGVDKAKLAAKKVQLNADIASGDPAKVAAANQQLDEIAQYELAKEMKNINVKRTDRGAIQIGLELTKIAADIATLTGVGAQVGTPLKIVASGIGAAMPIARTLKQAGRDRASKAGAWGITKAVFNADKSTEKKLEKRAHDTDLIFDMFAKLPTYDETDAAIVTRYNQVNSFVEAAGISLYTLEKFKGDPTELKKAIVEAMGKRE
ncbi:hypothetical protein [Paenibacillus qinlingensis]|uniref:Uncharacterized protein n=1 Tax=Paenibacillus qinlingensis TaxID=1837343 RepID=A0ABU1NX72_9BACL|nr:hypothetical protein [Paenibacillus qinlingensis]MDR6552035.1 hypothetical protein [Paenibacillus qinlingensis]